MKIDLKIYIIMDFNIFMIALNFGHRIHFIQIVKCSMADCQK